jgi:hypothetical protein
MNPYARYLGSLDPYAILPSTAERIRVLFAEHPPEWRDTPRAPGKWNPKQVLAHLADTEIVFAMRLRQTAAEPHHVIQPFDQDAWARNYSGVDPAASLAVFAAVRRWNLEFILAQPPEVFDKQVTHPERGTMTFRTIVETIAGHDLNHLEQF